MNGSEKAAPTSDRELVLTRLIDAPRERLYEAWTDPELLKRWFAPLPYTTPRAELDVRPGGATLVVMRDPQGNEYPNRGVYLEVVPNERLVITDAFSEAWQPSEKPFMTVILTFEEEGGKAERRATPPGCAIGALLTARLTNRWVSIRDGANARTSSKRWSKEADHAPSFRGALCASPEPRRASDPG
jgi:uncharacterized protein YndB with AHSA1/START domain